MNIPLQAVAEGRAEMAFWPVAATLYVFSITHATFDIVLIGVFAIAGGQTYILMRSAGEVIDQQQGFKKTYQQTSRSGVSNNQRVFEASMKQFWRMMPERASVRVIVAIGLFIDLIGGLFVLIRLVDVMPKGPDASLSGLVILFVPFLYLAVVLARILWQL